MEPSSPRHVLAHALALLLVALVVHADVTAQQATTDPSSTALARRLRDLDRPSAELLADADAVLSSTNRTDATLRAWAFLARSEARQSEGEYDASRAAAEQAIELVGSNPEAPTELAAQAHYQLSVAAYRQADYDTAKTQAQETLRIYEAHGTPDDLAHAHTLLGAIERRLGNYDDSLTAHFEALRISEEAGHEEAAARSQNNIGLNYWKLGRHEQARTYLARAVETYRKKQRVRTLATALSNLGLIEIELGHPDEAVKLLRQALPLFESQKNRAGKARVLSNLAFAQETLGDDEQAIQLQEQATAIRRQIQDRHGLVRSQGMMAKIHLRHDRIDRALQLVRDALDLAIEIGIRSEQAALYRTLSEVLEAKGDAEGALAAHQEFHAIDSELITTESRARIAELERRHEIDQHQRQIAELEQQAAARDAELQRKQLWQRVLIYGSVALAIGLLLLGWFHGMRNRALRALRRSHTELRESSQRLAESEQRYRTMFQGAVAPMLVIDTASRTIIDWNEPARRLCGLDSHESGQPVDTASPEWVRQALTRLFEEQLDDDVALDDCWIEPTGALRWTEVRGSAVSIDGRACQLLSLRETTREHEDQEARMRADRLESLGLMAGGIAHEFNNALTGISGHIALARSLESEQADECLAIAAEAAVHAGGLTKRLLAFARGGIPSRKVVDLRPMLRKSVDNAASGSQLNVYLQLAEELHPVELDASQFDQLVVGLVRHAIQAASGEGSLQIRASNFYGRPDATSSATARDYVRIDFEDDGVPIPADLRTRVFDPYFAPRQIGSGLGLATAYAIANRHDGALTLAANTERGTRFSVYLPKSATPLPAPSEDRQPADAAASIAGCSILVLEDDPMVQRVYRGVLEALGCDLEIVADGKDAIRSHRERRESGRSFDLMIMDLTITGGLGGKQALARIHEHDPDARAIVASGYTDDPTMVRHHEAGFVAALPKPFRPEDLSRAVARHVVRQR